MLSPLSNAPPLSMFRKKEKYSPETRNVPRIILERAQSCTPLSRQRGLRPLERCLLAVEIKPLIGDRRAGQLFSRSITGLKLDGRGG